MERLFLAIKVGIDASTPPFFSAGIRFFIAGLVLFLWMVWKGKARFSLLLQKEMLISGLCLTFGTFAMLYWAEQHVSSGIAAVLSATGPLMMLLIQIIFLRQKVTLRSILGCIVGFIGVVLMLLSSINISTDVWWMLGMGAILIGEIGYASGALYSKRVIQNMPKASPVALNAAQMIYGGVLLIILSIFTEDVQMGSLLNRNALGSLLYLIVIGSMVGHSLFYWLVAKTNPMFPTTWLYVSPMIAMGVGYLFYHEKVSGISMAGMITIIVGTLIANLDSFNQYIRRSKKMQRSSVLEEGNTRWKVTK